MYFKIKNTRIVSRPNNVCLCISNASDCILVQIFVAIEYKGILWQYFACDYCDRFSIFTWISIK